jgi:hypothetical protein
VPEYLHPGVYVQEVPSAVKPIEGVSTSTAGFVGVADKGPVPGFRMPFGHPPQPRLLTSFSEFVRTFGGWRADSYLTYAVQNFFDNGGKRAYVVRVAVADQPETSGYPARAGHNALLAAAALLDQAETIPSLVVLAQSPGAWANSLAIDVRPATSDPINRFKLAVTDHGDQVEQFDDLSMDANDPQFVDNIVNSRSEYVLVKAVQPAAAPPLTPLEAIPQNLSLTLQDDNGVDSLRVISPVRLGEQLTVTVTRPDQDTFGLRISAGNRALEAFDRLSMDPSHKVNFVELKINGVSRYVTVQALPGSSPPSTN